MQLFDPNNPNEKKKMIAAAVLGVAALAGLLFWAYRRYVLLDPDPTLTWTGLRIVAAEDELQLRAFWRQWFGHLSGLGKVETNDPVIRQRAALAR